MPLLNDAKTCYVGTTPITKIMAGDLQVWPKSVYPDTPGPFDMFYFPFEDSTKGVCPWVHYWDITNESTLTQYSFIPGKSGNCLHFDNDLLESYANVKIDFNSSYNMRGFLEVDGVPAAGPPTEENTAGIDCPAFDNFSLNDGYVDKDQHFWIWTRINQELVWYDIGIVGPSRYQGSRFAVDQQFAECYFKLPAELYAKPDVSDDIEDYNAQILCGSSTFLNGLGNWRVGIKVVEDNKAKLWLQGQYGPDPNSFYEKHYIEMPSDPWVHVSIGYIQTQSSDSANTYDLFYSFNGELFKRTQQVSGTQGFGMDDITFKVKKDINDTAAPYPDIDEIRTASTPLYTEDFNPS